MGNLQLLWTFTMAFSVYRLFPVGGNSSNRKIPIDLVELKCKETAHLDCTKVKNGTEVDIFWKKDGVRAPIGSMDIATIPAPFDGNYTCYRLTRNSMEVILKKFVVRVSVPPTPIDDSVCREGGEDERELWQEGKMCTVPRIDDYPCCKYSISPPQMLRLRPKLSNKVKNKCDLGAASNATPLKIDVTWNLTANATLIWGWHVKLTGLENAFGIRSCVQINSKDKKLNWTFNNLRFGATYDIKVDALPSDNKNFLVKKIVLPKRKDFCGKIGRKCHWEICFPVNNLQQEKKTSILSWSRSKYYKSWPKFEVFYNSTVANCKDSGSERVLNATRFNLEIDKCRSYYVKVRPMFQNERGIFSKPIVFFRPENEPAKENHVKVIVSCSTAVGILVVATIVILFVRRTRDKNPKPDPLIPQDTPTPVFSNKTKVFIVHDNHCKTCKNVTHSLANLLDKTGYVDCVLDFCRTKEINRQGYVWYESMIKSCDKIIIVCTKDGKRMYEQGQDIDGVYNFILKMLLGQMIHRQNKGLKIIPVYLDISTHEDVPLFLSEYKCYSLPSNIQDLCLVLRSEDHVNGNPSRDDARNELAQDITNLKCTIEMMGKNHKSYKKAKT